MHTVESPPQRCGDRTSGREERDADTAVRVGSHKLHPVHPDGCPTIYQGEPPVDQNRIRSTTPNADVVRPAKEVTTVRLSPAGRRRVADRAARADIAFSHMVRRMLAYSDMHMPDGWIPPQRGRSE